MKTLNNIIQEKILISKNTKVDNIKYTHLDFNNKDMMLDILRAEFISLYEQHFKRKPDPFKQKGLSIFTIRRTAVDYKNVIKVLNSPMFGYNFNFIEVEDKHSQLHNLIHYYLTPLDDLINMKTVNVKCAGGVIKGQNLYWNDWKEYKEKYFSINENHIFEKILINKDTIKTIKTEKYILFLPFKVIIKGKCYEVCDYDAIDLKDSENKRYKFYDIKGTIIFEMTTHGLNLLIDWRQRMMCDTCIGYTSVYLSNDNIEHKIN